MEIIKDAIKFIQDNWLVFLVLAGALLVLLKAFADFKVRWAKVTPETEDDAKAKLFKAKVMVIIQFIKDIFKLNKKEKDAK